jgi:CheY-like chemotaxis protein/anti-sigma regulatory factor (Ser/Thr protein kinase)
MAAGVNIPRSEEAAEHPQATGELKRLQGQFLSSMNHELRTPLSGIVGMTDLLLETALDEQQREWVATARLCADNLLTALNDTLEYSALSAGAVKLEESEFNLVETLRAVAAEHVRNAEAKGLKLLCIFEGRLPEAAIGDPLRLRKLLNCILGNALKFTQQGQVVMTASALMEGAQRFRLLLRIRDTGIGIPPDARKAIFDAFRQIEDGPSRSYAGLGLGLAIARRLVALMGGKIAVQSEADQGSVFTLSIPLEISAQLPAAALRPAPEVAASRQILVAEDDRIAQTVITHHLRRGGYEVVCVNSGEEALDAASKTRFDLVLMDLGLPGMDGLAATTALRALPGYASTPILALTAAYGEEYHKLCRDHDMQAYLTKPVRAEELWSTLRQFLP